MVKASHRGQARETRKALGIVSAQLPTRDTIIAGLTLPTTFIRILTRHPRAAVATDAIIYRVGLLL